MESYGDIQCAHCKHLDRKQMNQRNLCEAFPAEGIPWDIIDRKFDHTKKHPKQDNDIVFEPIEEK